MDKMTNGDLWLPFLCATAYPLVKDAKRRAWNPRWRGEVVPPVLSQPLVTMQYGVDIEHDFTIDL